MSVYFVSYERVWMVLVRSNEAM